MARRGIGVRSPFRKDAVPQKHPRLLGILLVPDGGSWKRKTGQKAGLEGFQSIQRNAVELDVVRRQESNRLPQCQRIWRLIQFQYAKRYSFGHSALARRHKGMRLRATFGALSGRPKHPHRDIRAGEP